MMSPTSHASTVRRQKGHYSTDNSPRFAESDCIDTRNLRWHRHPVTRRVRLCRKNPLGLSERCIFGMLPESRVAMGRCVHCMGRRVSCICLPRQQDFHFLWTSNVRDSMSFASPGDVPLVIVAKYSRGRESEERHEKYRYSRISPVLLRLFTSFFPSDLGQ